MNLSPQDCRTILSRHYAAADVKEKKKLKQLDHTQRVLFLCRTLAPQLPPPLQTDLLFASALLHDIAKFDHGPHHLRAAAVLDSVYTSLKNVI